jgi:hypothetical protein
MQAHVSVQVALINELQSPSDRIRMVTQVMQEWCNKHIWVTQGTRHRCNTKLGAQHKFIKKMVKSQQHITQAITRNEKPTITTAMKKLNRAPEWAHVPLLENMDQTSMLAYLQDINSKKMIANKKLKTTVGKTQSKHKSNTFNKLVTLHCMDTK